MKIISVHSRRALEKAAAHLASGGVLIYPTETSYGVGAIISNIAALEKVRELKGRGKKPFLILVSSIRMAHRYAQLGPIGDSLAKEYWPGPLTIAAESKRNQKIPLQYISTQKDIALRHSGNLFATALVKRLNVPITSTSANLSGKPPCYSVPAVVRQFGKRRLHDVMIIDAGRLPTKKPSTLVIVSKGSFRVVRQGSITV